MVAALMRIAAMVAFLLIAASGSAQADPKRAQPSQRKTAPAKHRPTQFLGLNPHGPLAVSVGGTIEQPEDDACRKWGVRGGEWQALDRLGRVAGKARVRELDRYDVTDCDELSLDGAKGAGIYVRGPYQALDIEPFQPSKSQLVKLRKLVQRRDEARPPSASGKKDAPFRKRALLFSVKGQDPIAVVGGRALSVFRLGKKGWVLEHQIEANKQDTWDPNVFSVVAVLDMNHDGVPEIVIHESFIDGYNDSTLVLEPEHRTWRSVAPGIHGGYA